MTGAKSALEVKDDMTFLDLTVRQIEHLNTTHKVDVPLILMTSFNTHEDTLRIIKKYANQQLRITTFNQSRYPRILKEGLLPAPSAAADDKDKWYPPGHGGNMTPKLKYGTVADHLQTCTTPYCTVVYWTSSFLKAKNTSSFLTRTISVPCKQQRSDSSLVEIDLDEKGGPSHSRTHDTD
jgi:hypothetical protein